MLFSSSITGGTTQVDFSLPVVDAARTLTTEVQKSAVQIILQALQAEGGLDFSEVDDDNDDETLPQSNTCERRLRTQANQHGVLEDAA